MWPFNSLLPKRQSDRGHGQWRKFSNHFRGMVLECVRPLKRVKISVVLFLCVYPYACIKINKNRCNGILLSHSYFCWIKPTSLCRGHGNHKNSPISSILAMHEQSDSKIPNFYIYFNNFCILYKISYNFFGYRIKFNSLHSILICTKIFDIKASDLLLVIHLLNNHQFGCLHVGVKGLNGIRIKSVFLDIGNFG